MSLLAIVASLFALQGNAAAAQEPAFVNAPVTAPMVIAAVDICTRQIQARAFDGAALTGAGWVLAIRGGEVIRGYRHPDNMILLTTFDSADSPDKCTVMAPTGRGLNIHQMHAALEQRMGGQATAEGGQAVWTPTGLRLTMQSMAQDVGVVIEVTPR